jgi:hypothetical protein
MRTKHGEDTQIRGVPGLTRVRRFVLTSPLPHGVSSVLLSVRRIDHLSMHLYGAGDGSVRDALL